MEIPKRLTAFAFFAGVILGFAACGSFSKNLFQDSKGNGAGPAKSEPTGVDPAGVGLSHAALSDVPDPIQFTYKREEDLKPYRFNRFAPPIVPHDITDNLPITKTQNDCLDCHEAGKPSADGPPPLPVSHLTNHRTGEKAAKMYSGRYNCVACHVPQSNAVPLVGNSYKP